MPVTVEIVGVTDVAPLEAVFAYFEAVDLRFSTYKPDSEIEAINRGEICQDGYSEQMREVLELAEQTRRETGGYFNVTRPDGRIDPSGIVKGWAIRNAAQMIAGAGFAHYYVDAGGDIQASGRNDEGRDWAVGIRSPFESSEIVKVVCPRGRGVATSGSYVRGQHIYNPRAPDQPVTDIVSLTVIGADVLEADRFATAAFAMGKDGIYFIERTPGVEAYVISAGGRATLTSGFEAYCAS